MIVNDEPKRMWKQAVMACCKVVLVFIYRDGEKQDKCRFVGMGVGRNFEKH
jgi:hypothetical protein